MCFPARAHPALPRRSLCVVAALLAASACGDESTPPTPVDLISHVNPFVGTGGFGFGYGGLSPAATVPNGMVKFGPDTSNGNSAAPINHSAGYFYDDNRLRAFSLTRLPGIGVSDGGGLGIMLAGQNSIAAQDVRAPYDHADESASPGYYALGIADRGRVELTAAPRAGVGRWSWTTPERWLVVDLAHGGADDVMGTDGELVVDSINAELRGKLILRGSLTGRQGRGLPIYFVIRFSSPWQAIHVWQNGAEVSDAAAPQSGDGLAATVQFATDVETRIGISWVDEAGAVANLDADVGTRDFATVRANAEATWRTVLSAIEIQGGSPTEQHIFATALYNTFQMPTLATDVDGRYRGVDGEVHSAEGFTYYSDFSLWDTYRTLHPLVTLVWPELASDFAQSLAAMGEALGYFPRWPAGVVEAGSMVGSSADIVLADSALKNITFAEQQVFDLATTRAMDTVFPGAREELDDYLAHGYLPVEATGGATSKTLEYAVEDAALAAWAERLGSDVIAQTFRERGAYWRNVFDAEAGFVRGRHADGSWVDASPDFWQDHFTEGNAWHYTFMVPHDPQGLADAFGGAANLRAKLEVFFGSAGGETEPFLPGAYYWHGNEPDIHSAFLFAEVGDPASTQRWVEWVRQQKYKDAPDGLAGNDDGGTLSAWYVFSCLGLYPVPASTRYILTTPVFSRAVVRRPDATIQIVSEGEGRFIERATLGDTVLTRASITHDDLLSEGSLTIQRRADAATSGGF